MADSRRYALTPQLDLDQILQEAQQRWLRPAEICEILRNYRRFKISPEPPTRPPSGSLFLFDRKVLRYFRKDGHSWRKKKDGKTVKEAHERLKAGSIDVLHCYYAHGEENENFQRRSYWMLEEDYMHIVLVHYLQVKNSKASYIRARDAEDTAYVANVESPSSSYTNHSHLPSSTTDAGSPNSTQTSDYNDPESADNYQGNSRYNSITEMQQYGAGQVRDTNLLNAYASVPLLNDRGDHQRSQAAGPESNLFSIGQVDYSRVIDETGLEWTSTQSKTQFGVASWEQVLNNPQNVLFDPTTDSIGAAVPDNSKQQYSFTIDDFANVLGVNFEDSSPNLGRPDWQLDSIEVGSVISNTAASNHDVDGSLSNEAKAHLLKQLSLELSNKEGELKKHDSFSRWMINELDAVDESPLQSTSDAYWMTLESETVGDVSSMPNQEQFDSYLVGPSISQEQLFSIADFSPSWAYADHETKVLITGTFLKKKNDVQKCRWSCMFGEIEVPANIVGDGTLCCYAPPHKSGRVHFYITCSDRSACSEVREFEYRELNDLHMETLAFYSGNINESDLHKRLDKLLSLDSIEQLTPASRITSDKQRLINEINTLMIEVDDEWFNMFTPLKERQISSSNGQDLYREKLLKEKLHAWLLYKVSEDGKGPCMLDEDGQGVIHLAAALGYDWAITPTITAGVKVNFRDAHGWTALHWAAFCGRERTVATLVGLGADCGPLTDPSPEYRSGRTPADLASFSGHKGIAGFLAECALTRHLVTLTLKDSKVNDPSQVSSLLGTEDISSQTSIKNVDGDPSLKSSLSAVRNASQAAARIHQVFRVQSFHRKKLMEYSDDKSGVSDERALSVLSRKPVKSAQHDLPVHAAATRIQNKFRGWKGRKEFLIIRQRIVKIQAHVRGHQVRKHYKKIVSTVFIVEKAILRWRRRGSGFRNFGSEGITEGASSSTQNKSPKEDDYDFLKEGRKQTEVRLEKALARVKSMVQYPEARDQYSRLQNVVSRLQESKEMAMNEDTEDVGDADLMTGLEEILKEDSFMPSI